MAKGITDKTADGQALLADLSVLTAQSRNFVVVQANSVMTMLFWNVGKRINEDILQNKRAEYGKQIVEKVIWKTPFCASWNALSSNLDKVSPLQNVKSE